MMATAAVAAATAAAAAAARARAQVVAHGSSLLNTRVDTAAAAALVVFVAVVTVATAAADVAAVAAAAKTNTSGTRLQDDSHIIQAPKSARAASRAMSARTPLVFELRGRSRAVAAAAVFAAAAAVVDVVAAHDAFGSGVDRGSDDKRCASLASERARFVDEQAAAACARA